MLLQYIEVLKIKMLAHFNNNPNLKVYLAKIGLILTTLAWGATFVITDEALKEMAPFTLNGYRFLVACLSTYLMIFIISRYNKYEISNITKLEFIGGLVCGLFLFLGYSLQNFGLFGEVDSIDGAATPTNSAFVTSVSVVLVPLFLVLTGRQKISVSIWYSVFLALIGLMMLLNPFESGFVKGDILTFGCAIFFACHIIAQDNYVKKDINIFRFFLVQIGLASILSFICGFAFEINHQPTIWSNTVINAILINGIIATTFAIMIMVWAQRIVTPSQTAIFFSLEPLFAALFSWIYIGEKLSLLGWAGGLTIIFAILLSDN